MFGLDGMFGNPTISGANADTYAPNVSIGNPPDNSQYTDYGQDPESGGGGDWASTLGVVVNDAFRAYQISQTPTPYRAAAPGSPASIQAVAAAQAAKTQNTVMVLGVIVILGIILYMLFKKG